MGQNTPCRWVTANRLRAEGITLLQAVAEAHASGWAAPSASRWSRATIGGVIAEVRQRGGTLGSDDGAGEPEAARGRRRRAVHRQPPPLSTPEAPEPARARQTPARPRRPRRERPARWRRHAGQRLLATRRRAGRQATNGGGTRRQRGYSAAGGGTPGLRAGRRALSASGAAHERAGWVRSRRTYDSCSTCSGGAAS